MTERSEESGSGANEYSVRILWLRPTVGTHISTRRERIKEGLIDRGVLVDILDASGTDAIEAIKQALSREYDLVVGTVRVGVYYGYLLAKLKGVPFVAEVTEPMERVDDLPKPIYGFFSWYEKKILRRADVCFFVEEEVLKNARRNGIDGYLAKNSVWYEQFADPDPEIVDFAQERLSSVGIIPTQPTAIYIGGFTEQQHIPQILDAADRVSEWQFLFLGEDGKHAEMVEEAAATKPNVYFHDAVPHHKVPGFLSFADVGFSLSTGERPLKLLEYGAAGLPVLGRPGKRQHEFSDEEVNYIDPTRSKIAHTLETMRKRPEAITADGTALQKKARKNSWDGIAQKYYEVFKDLAEE